MIIAPLLLLPFAIALLLVSFMKSSKMIAYTSIGASLASLAMLPFLSFGTFAINWFSVGGFMFDIVSSVSITNFVLLFIVLLLSPLIYTYSLGYFKQRSEFKRYYIEMLIFTMAMVAFAIAGNFILLFVAWEFLSITSYTLIGFWYKRRNASLAARKAVTIVFIGDIALLASIAIIWNFCSTLTFSSISTIPKSAVLLLIIAILTKSAQFPFNEWLPDAMEGPTPVSAYLHSATMVKAGVFAAIVLLPLFERAHALAYFLVIGLFTAIIATLNAMKETHVKRILAYSTVQELGLMLSAVGIGAISAALYFFFAQAFYKALLFFSSGIMIDANENENINSIYGLKKNKFVYISTLFGVLALAGFIPFDGFFSNVGLSSSFSKDLYAYILLSLISVGTSFFIFRWLFVTSKDTNNRNVVVSYLAQPRSMLASTYLLAAFTLAASVAFFYFPLLGYSISIKLDEAIIETLLVAIGLAISYFAYVRKKISIEAKILEKIAYNSVFVNMFYEVLAKFAYLIGKGVEVFDLYINDLFDWIGHIVARLGDIGRVLVNGDVSFYALIMVVSLLAISALVLFV